MTRVRACAPALLLVCSCATAATPGDPSAQAASAPLTGVPASGDSADRQCHVVLRDLARVPDGSGGYLSQDGVWIWDGHVDLSAAAAAEGLVPWILYQYGSDQTWWAVAPYPSDDAAPAGFARYDFRLESGLPGPGMSGSPLASARVRVIPYLALPAGGRLFDHNRRPGDFDVYELAWHDNGFAIADDPAACPGGSAPPAPPPPSPPPAVTPVADLWFDADQAERQLAPIVAGGRVVVHYAIERLTGCRGTHNGYPAWDLIAHARFSPGGETAQASVRGFDSQYGHPVGPGHSVPAGFDVPAGATGVELWFENTGIGCQAWDSAFGANYAFEVVPPPSWLGDVAARLTRESGARCAGGAPASDTPFAYDTWVRQRALIRNLCFEAWQPGLTDVWPADLWQRLDARVHWRLVGADGPTGWQWAWASLDGQDGDNARWYFDLGALDPFSAYDCPAVPTGLADGAGLVHVEAELFMTVNGVELRPAGPGSSYRVRYSDYARPGCP